jgi:hypothetical protein
MSSAFQRFDRRGNLTQIIVELMIAVAQAMDAGLWNRTRIELGMRRRRGFIVEPMVDKDGNVSGKPRAEVGRGIHVLTRPAPIADKGCRDQEDRAKLPL